MGWLTCWFGLGRLVVHPDYYRFRKKRQTREFGFLPHFRFFVSSLSLLLCYANFSLFILDSDTRSIHFSGQSPRTYPFVLAYSSFLFPVLIILI